MLAMEYGIWNFPGGLWSTTGLAAFSNATITPIAALPSANDSSAAAVAAAAAAAAGYTITAHGIIGNVAAAAAFQAERLCNESTLQSTDNNTSDQNSDTNSSDANQDGVAIATESETQTDLNLTNDLSNACDDNAVDNHIKIESQIGFLAQQYAPVYNFVLGQFNNNQNVQTSETEESSDDENTKATLNENSHQNSTKDSTTVIQANEPVYEVVSEPQMHKCPVAGCDYKATGIDVLEKHVTTHSEKGGKNKKGSSMQRIRYEREEYHCGACTYTCTTERAYVRHLRAHAAGEADAAAPRVSCAVCGRDRRGEAALARHMRKHREDRFFCCDLCVFRTVQLKKLIQHRRMHTGEKPHLCPHCTYRSARRDNLRSHVRRVHKRDNLLCDTFSPRGMLLAPSSASTKTTSENNNAAVTDQSQIAATTNTETVSSKQSIE